MGNSSQTTAEALRSERDFIATIMDAVQSLIVVLDRHGRIARFNLACEQMTGLALAQVQGTPFWKALVAPEEAAVVKARFARIGRGEVPSRIETQCLTGEGELRLVSWSNTILVDEDGDLEFVIATGLDVTEQRLAEAALAENAERYRGMFEASLTGNYIVTADGTLVACNETFARLFGFDSVEEALDAPLASLYADPADRAEFFTLVRNHTAVDRRETVLRHKDGSSVHALESATGTFDRDGNVVQIMGLLFDDSKRKRLEDDLRQAQKMDAIGRLAGGIAHDFNNALTVIAGYGEFLLRRITSEGGQRENVEQILGACRKATDLTRQLLAFSRKQILQPKPLDLNAIMIDIGRMIRPLVGEGIDLLVATEPDIWSVKADPSQVEQVIMNLVANARDAMGEAGNLTMETKNVWVGENHAKMPAGEYVMLAVTDTGIGMDEETRRRVFEPFFTTKPVGQGTGLGLATVYGIVKQSGGFIWVYSEYGQGTTIKVYLPRIHESAERPSEGPTAQQSGRGGSETVLLVEDEQSVRKLAGTTLRMAGYNVVEAANGLEALELCEIHEGPIHLMVTDVVMPVMNGRQLFERVTEKRSDIRTLFISGYTGTSVFHNGVLERDTAFLEKPFTPAALVVKVREVLDGSDLRQASPRA